MLLVSAGLAASGAIHCKYFRNLYRKTLNNVNGVARPNLAVHLCGSHGGTYRNRWFSAQSIKT